MNRQTSLRKSIVGGILACGLLAFGTGCDSVGEDDTLEYEIVSFTALNADLQDETITARADFEVEDGLFKVELDADNVFPGIMHAQHIHAASTCPGPEADTTGDGIVDVLEGIPSYGGILIPLDDNLASQATDNFQTANAEGEYEFTASADYDAVLESIRGEDEDLFVEIGADEELNLATRTVVIHGVDPSTNLPETVGTLPGMEATATLPIACAEIVAVD